jgi:hypothetical protein
VASHVKKDDLFFSQHHSQRDAVIIGQADRLLTFQLASEVVELEVRLE